MTRHHSKRPSHGYVLFEAVLALMIFSVAVLGLARSLNSALDTAVDLNRDNAIRMGLRSFIEETRRKEVADMATEVADERLGVTYSSTVEELTLKNKDGAVLNDLYVLHAKAARDGAGDDRAESVDLYLYKPSISQNSTTGNSRTGSSTTTTTPGTSTGGSTATGSSGGASAAPARASR